jgi:hypothetical protein
MYYLPNYLHQQRGFSYPIVLIGVVVFILILFVIFQNMNSNKTTIPEEDQVQNVAPSHQPGVHFITE